MSCTICPSCSGDSIHQIPRMTWTERVTYFRCNECWHVWVIRADGQIHHVTPLPLYARRKGHAPPAATKAH